MLVLSIPRLRRSQGPIAQKPRVQSWLLHQPQPSLGPPEKSSRDPGWLPLVNHRRKSHLSPMNERHARESPKRDRRAPLFTLRCALGGSHAPAMATIRGKRVAPTAGHQPWSWRGQSACPHPVLLRLRLSPYFRPSAFDATLLQSLHSGLQPMLLNSSFRSKKGRFDGSKFERYM